MLEMQLGKPAALVPSEGEWHGPVTQRQDRGQAGKGQKQKKTKCLSVRDLDGNQGEAA